MTEQETQAPIGAAEIFTSTAPGTTVTAQGEHHKNTVTGAALVTSSARVITRQAEITHIQEIPNLPTHQRAAKEQSHKWLNEIWPLIINTTADIIDYANKFQSLYTELLTLVPKLEQGDTKARDEFIATMEKYLKPALQSKASAAKNTADKISAFHDAYQPLYTAFHEDFLKANALLTKDQQELRAKQKEYDYWNGKAADYIHAAIGLFLGAAVTGTATAMIGPTGVGLLVGAFLMVSELVVTAVLIKEYVDAFKRAMSLSDDIYDLHQQVAELNMIKTQIGGLQSNSQKVVSGSASAAQGWTTLTSELDNTIEYLKKISPAEAAGVIKTQLSAANTEWGKVLEQARALQPNGGQIPHKTFATLTDMLKAMQEPQG